MFLEHLHQSGFSDPGFAAHQEHSSFAFRCPLPFADKQIDLVIPAGQRGQAGAFDCLESAPSRAFVEDLVEFLGSFHSLERMGSDTVVGEKSLDEFLGGRADDHGILLGNRLDSGCDVEGVPQCHSLPVSTSVIVGDHEAGVNSDSHFQGMSNGVLEPLAQSDHRLDDGKPGTNGPMGIVFVSCGITEKDENTVAEIVGDLSRVAFADGPAGGVILVDDGVEVFGVEFLGELGKRSEIAEDDRELS